MEPRTPLVVLLLTPGHIGMLDVPRKGIVSLLFRTFPKPKDDRRIDVLIAVVDRIPRVDSTSNRSYPPPHDVVNEGSEGISVAVLDSEVAAPDLWSPREMSTERDSMTIEQRCSISFALRDSRHPKKLEKFQLPVANTLFLNGKTSTLVAQHWVQHSSNNENPRFEFVEQKSLPEQVLNMTFGIAPNDVGMQLSLRCHLERITTPRTVSASVGNIIQKISLRSENPLEEDVPEDAPASQELEVAIQQSIRDGKMSNQHAEVWALLSPQGKRYHDKMRQEGFYAGCQLRKVLSGGGGWGVKQGLLSLDPDSDYKSLVEQPEATSFPILAEDENREIKMFENIVRPGDSITFYANKIHDVAFMGPDASSRHKSLPYHLFQFGTIPSTMDATQAAVSPKTNPKTRAQAVFINKHFGVLSEQGMSFEVGTPKALDNPCN